MNKLIFSLIICLSFSTAHALTYEQAETYSVCGVALTATDTVAESTGNIVTSPDTHFGLPDGTPVYVEGMTSTGLGSSGESAKIIETLRKALDANTDQNDLMHWYVTAGRNVVYCTPNSFRCDYVKQKTAVVLGLWMPRDAKEITVSFTSQSKQLSLAIYTYDYETHTMTEHTSTNNGFQNSHAPNSVYTFNETFYPNTENGGTYSGQYLFLMFNSAESEKNWIDINGLGVSYTPVDPEETPDVGEYAPIFPGYVPPADDGGNTTVPEPSGAMLSLLALATLAVRRRRR